MPNHQSELTELLHRKDMLEAEYAELRRTLDTPLVERRRTKIRDIIGSINRQISKVTQ